MYEQLIPFDESVGHAGLFIGVGQPIHFECPSIFTMCPSIHIHHVHVVQKVEVWAMCTVLSMLVTYAALFKLSRKESSGGGGGGGRTVKFSVAFLRIMCALSLERLLTDDPHSAEE